MKTAEDDQPLDKTTPADNELSKSQGNQVQPFSLNNGQNKKRNFTQQQKNEFKGDENQVDNDQVDV